MPAREAAIGRDSSSDLWIADPALSCRPCLVATEAGQFIVRDLGSKNGTLVNGTPVAFHGQVRERVGVDCELMSVTHPSPSKLEAIDRRRVRKRLLVTGIVQGVGFRPFVYKLAKRLALAGFVLNTSSGVAIEIEGAACDLERFHQSFLTELPPAARVESMQVADCEPCCDSEFLIQSSVAVAGKYSLVSTDLALCDECRRELTDSYDRRFGYPFINCANCGPRYTIIQDVPYDRPATTMAKFRICAACAAEYEDPSDRRFHAQPNACAAVPESH